MNNYLNTLDINKILNTVHNEDCIKFMKRLPNECIDLIIADPPYFRICGDFDFIFNSKDEYISWCKQWILECKRILKPNGTLMIWGKIGHEIGMCFPKIATWLEDNNDFYVKDWITQRNSRGRGTKKGYMSAREELLFLTKDNNKYTLNTAYTKEKSNRKDLGANGKPRKNKFKRCSNVWIDIAEASQSSKERFKLKNGDSFPTIKALKSCDRIINTHSNKNDILFIPFAGGGSEIVSCISNNRYYIATEINEKYINEILKPRLKKLYANMTETKG